MGRIVLTIDTAGKVAERQISRSNPDLEETTRLWLHVAPVIAALRTSGRMWRLRKAIAAEAQSELEGGTHG